MQELKAFLPHATSTLSLDGNYATSALMIDGRLYTWANEQPATQSVKAVQFLLPETIVWSSTGDGAMNLVTTRGDVLLWEPKRLVGSMIKEVPAIPDVRLIAMTFPSTVVVTSNGKLT